ncbi:MAG: MerR family transcriptional regulator [Pseudomonadota bacterium]
MVNKSADAFRTISEVAEWLGVQTHVLRFWESKFSQVKPVKRAGGRRYYRPADMLLLGGIRKLLHEDGMTIKGVQKILREEGMAHVSDMSPPLDEMTAAQVDADLMVSDGAIEHEMAPAADDAPEADMVEDAPEPGFEHRQMDAPDVDDSPVEAAPEPVAWTDTPAEDAAAEDAEPESETPIFSAFAREPSIEDTPTPVEQVEDTPTPAPQEDAAPSLPAFMRSAPAAEPEAPEPDAAPAPDSLAASAPSGLPSFMAPPEEAAPEPAPEPAEPEAPEAPRPRIVDVSDDPDPAALDVRPSALTLATRATALTPAQRDALAPLLAQLTALRDTMASARGDSR